MVYKDFDELNKHHQKDRNDMDFEEELMYVEDCFDTYEALGFKDKFTTPYDQHKDREGQKFDVMRRLMYSTGEADLECLPMWRIMFSDGYAIDAYPEEICLAEGGDTE